LHSAAQLPSHQGQQMDDDAFIRASRCFLMDWARRNGVSCPPDVLRDFAAQWERKRIRADGRRLVAQNGCADLHRCEVPIAEICVTSWMVERGPAYFGLNWSFEYALLRELQISGMAAQLLANDSTK
jgi:hypothetical protein